MSEHDSTSQQQIDFPDERKYLDTITQAADSQPTKTKVAAFKNRVFRLIKIYSEKAQNVNPLLESLSQETFSKQPTKMNEIVSILLNKHNIDFQAAQFTKLLDIYKVMLLYKTKGDIFNKLSETFVRMLKKILSEDS